MIERGQKTHVHKGAIIRCLNDNPADLAAIFPDSRFSSAAQAIAALERCSGKWFVNGVLQT